MAVECINWDVYDVPRIWQMVAVEDDERGWAQINSWYRLQSATDAQRERLVQCRRSLEQKWPPKRSAAADAFVRYLDGLIASMEETARAAASTARGLSGIMHALARAKQRVEPIHERWARASHDWMPDFVSDDREELNRQARVVMAETDRAVADYTPMIQSPPPYITQAPHEDFEMVSPPSASAPLERQLSARNSGMDGDRATGGTADTATSVPPLPHNPPPPMSQDNGWETGNVGPGLAEGVINPPTVVPGTTIPSTVPTTPVGSGPGPALPLGQPAGGFVGSNPNSSGSVIRSGGHATGGGPVSRTSEGPAGKRATRGMSSDGIAAGPMASMPGRSGSRRKRVSQASPDEVWPIQEGVSPVIEASPHDPEHDPGPGVIGIDR